MTDQQNNYDVIRYNLVIAVSSRYRSEGANDWQTMMVVPNDTTSLTLHALNPGTNYQFAVMSRDPESGSCHFSCFVTDFTAGIAYVCRTYLVFVKKPTNWRGPREMLRRQWKFRDLKT